MKLQYTLRAVALASTCLIPLAAQAQQATDYTGQATAGVRYQSGTSALFGRYNGNPDKGFSGTGDLSVQDRDAWNSGGTTYFEAQGDNLSFNGHLLAPNSSGEVKYGEQGSWGVKVYADGIHYTQSTTFHSPVGSSGNLRLNPGSLGLNSGQTYTSTTPPALGATAAQLNAGTATLNGIYSTLNGANSPVEVGTQRAIVGATGSWSPGGNWTFTGGIQHEHKEGTKENSLVTNGTTNFMYFPEPVDYDTDRYTATAAYNTRRLQGSLSYTFSNFTDNVSAFTTKNPFNIATASLAPGYAATTYSLPPSNDAHQIKGQFGYNLTPTTRLNANLGYELMQQNAGYTPAYIGAPSNPYIPGNSYNATAQNLFGNVAITTRPFDRTDFRASYTVDDRINNGNRVYIPNVANGMITADTTGSNHVSVANLPVSTLNQTVKLEAGYRVTDVTKLSLNYTFADKQENYSVTDHSNENTVGARVNTVLAPDLTGSLSYAHSVRTASAYNSNGAWQASTYSATNYPNSGMYYLAARTRDELKSHIDLSLSENATFGLVGGFTNDHYPTSVDGVTNSHTISVGPDISYTPTKNLTTHFFYTFEEVFTGQNFSSSQTATAARTDWTLGNKDIIHTVGAKADWAVTDSLKLKFEDNLSYGATAFNEGYVFLNQQTNVNYALLAANTVGQLPDDTTITNTLSLTGEYKLRDNITLVGGYTFARNISKDYLYGQAAGSSANGANVVSLGADGNPSYSIHVIGAAVRVKW